jgi:hypothetical protein
MITYTDLLGIRISDSPRDLLTSIKAPIGMRWPGTDKSMGFLLGGRPAFYLMNDFGNGTSLNVGCSWRRQKD